MWSQVGLRKHHYEQSQWRWWDCSWAISNPKRWCCESATINMSANLESSAVATHCKRSVFIPIPEKDNAKECSSYYTIALISHNNKVMLKIHQFSSVQSRSHVRFFVTPWNAALQASLSITNSRSPPKPMSIESVMLFKHLILCCPLPLALNLSQHQGLYKGFSSSHQVAKVLEFQLQHQSYQWTTRTNLL